MKVKCLKPIFFFIAVFLCHNLWAQKIEILEGEFVFNSISNEAYKADTAQRLNFKKTLDSMNLQKLNKYVEIMFSAEKQNDFDRATEIKNSDPFFKNIPELAMFIFYTLYDVYKLGLL